MPTTIVDAFAAAGLVRRGVVKWGTAPNSSDPGVYIVALTASPDSFDGKLIEAPLAAAEFQRWLGARPELTLDGNRPTPQQLTARIRRFWIPDEVILYIGLAGTSLSGRVGQYYNTPIGKRSPHAGGYFLKLLSDRTRLWVHYAECANFEAAEHRMLQRFCANVSRDSRQTLHDPTHPFPFANLESPRGTRKVHGLHGACGPKRKTPTVGAFRSKAFVHVLASVARQDYATQRITAHDLQRGQIRIPSKGASPTKSLFPPRKEAIDVILGGRLVPGKWDPRMGPDRERSGVLRVGSVLRELVCEDDVLRASAGEGGIVCILTVRGCSVSR
ncbi:MAG: hypothetical protein WAL89_01375 [Candidatus Sulfotelmatobacter sp.]|jgi:hypothetical protein